MASGRSLVCYYRPPSPRGCADIEQQIVGSSQRLFIFGAQPYSGCLRNPTGRNAGGEAAPKRAYCARLIGDAGLSDPNLFPAARGNGLCARIGDD
jgi:hypothetical protein